MNHDIIIYNRKDVLKMMSQKWRRIDGDGCVLTPIISDYPFNSNGIVIMREMVN